MIEGHFWRLVNSVFYVKGCMLSRFTVMMRVSIAVVRGKLRFLSRRPRDLWPCIFRHSFCFLGTNYSTIAAVGSLGEVFAHGAEFPLAFLKVVGLGHGVENYCCHCSHCLGKNKGGCLFGLFNYDSFVSFWAIGVIWVI